MSRNTRETPWLARSGEKGTFYACRRDPASGRTRRSSLKTNDPRIASGRFAAFLTGGGAARAACPSVETVLDAYMRDHIRRKAVDVTRAENMASHILAFFGGMALNAVDIPLSRSYADARRSGAISGQRCIAASDATVRKELAMLTAAANHALRWKIIDASQKPNVELPAGSDPRPDWLTKPELDRLRAEARGDHELRLFVELGYWTAARRQSIERLLWQQVDFDAGIIDLSQPGDKVTKKRRPTVPLFRELRPILEAHHAVSAGEYVFGRKGNASKVFYEPFRRAALRAGLTDKANPHVLRHSRATHLLMDGKSIYAVAKLLGDTVATVERYYGKYAAKGLEELLD